MCVVGRVQCILRFLYIAVAVCLIFLCGWYYFVLIFRHITSKAPLRCVYIVFRFDLPHSLVMSSQMGIFLLPFDPFQIHFYLFPMSSIKLELLAVLINCLKIFLDQYISCHFSSVKAWLLLLLFEPKCHLFCSVYTMFFLICMLLHHLSIFVTWSVTLSSDSLTISVGNVINCRSTIISQMFCAIQ